MEGRAQTLTDLSLSQPDKVSPHRGADQSKMAEAKGGGSVALDSKPGTNSAVFTEHIAQIGAGISSLLDSELEYRMNHTRRGRALIFNHERFEDSDIPSRPGTEADRNNLKERLKDLNFEVEIYDDRKRSEILKKIDEASKADHSDADCFLLAFLSHGKEDNLYTYDDKIKIDDITSPFKGDKCRSLVGKPKIFIIQACRGETYDEPVVACAADDDEDEEMVDASAIHTLPAGADFIMCYSVAEGYFSFRNSLYGSWYIQDLCKMLQNHGKSLEFTDLLTRVNNSVSKRSARSDDVRADGKKQIPCFASMLTKKMYFGQK